MFIKPQSQRICQRWWLFTLPLLLGTYGLAQAPVSIQAGEFETAREKRALKAYRIKEGYKGYEHAKQLGEKLFSKARASQVLSLKADRTNNLIHISKDDSSGFFRINRTTGDFSFSKGLKDYANDRTPPGLPAEDAAVEIAKRYLREFGEMPQNENEMFLQHVGGLKMIEVKEDETVLEVNKLVTIHFGRKIDGIEVGGPGSKIIVSLGANGELVSMSKRWAEVQVEAKRRGNFLGKSEVHANMKAKLQREAALAKKIVSSPPDFGYFDDGNGNIEPAYFFLATLTYDSVEKRAGEGHVDKYFGAVPALKAPKADFRQQAKAAIPPHQGKKPEADAEPVEDED